MECKLLLRGHGKKHSIKRKTTALTRHHQLDELKWHKEGAGANQCVSACRMRKPIRVHLHMCVRLNEWRDWSTREWNTPWAPAGMSHQKPAQTSLPVLHWSTTPYYLKIGRCVCTTKLKWVAARDELFHICFPISKHSTFVFKRQVGILLPESGFKISRNWISPRSVNENLPGILTSDWCALVFSYRSHLTPASFSFCMHHSLLCSLFGRFWQNTK